MLFGRFNMAVNVVLIELNRRKIVLGKRANALPAAMRIDGQIPDDAEEPAPKLIGSIEMVDARDRSCHGLLADILRVVRVLREVVAEAVESVLMPPQKQTQCVVVT